MSRQAIAAVLARDDLVGGERLVAFSLASFAGRDDRAWPGAPAASARAGLSRSRYLYVRDRLVERGLVVVESEASGRGRASLLALPFVTEGRGWRGRSTRSCSRQSCPALAGFRARNCQRRPAWRIARTAVRARNCSTPASWSS